MKRQKAVELYNAAMTASVHVRNLVDEQNAKKVRKVTKAMWRLYRENKQLKARLDRVGKLCKEADSTTDYISAVTSIQELVS